MVRSVVRIACIGAFLGWMVGCGPARTLDSGDTEPVRIGLVISLGGDLGGAGRDRINAVELAVREVNAAGGVLPARMVELIAKDGASMPDLAAQAASEIVADDRTGPRVVGLIGDSGSSSTLRIYQEVTQPTETLHASGSSTSPLLDAVPRDLSTDGWFFRTAPSDDAQAPVLAAAMASRGCTSVVLVHLANDYGTPFEVQMRARFQALGVNVLGSVPITDGLADYSAAASEVAMAAPECAALIAYPGSAGRVLRAWAAVPLHPDVRWFGADALRQPGFLAEAGDLSAISFHGTAPITDPATPAYNAFHAAYVATYVREPSTYSANFYDAAALMLLSIAAAGEASPRAMRAALPTLSDPEGTLVRAGQLAEGLRLLRAGESINYEGASGPVDVDERGEVAGVFELWTITAGAFVREEIIFPD